MDERIAAALDDAFPERTVDAVASPDDDWSEDGRTVQVRFGDGARAYLKVGGDGRRVARERAALAYVDATCPVPVPTVLAGDPDGDPPYLATTALSGPTVGETWDDADRADRTATVAAAGRALAAVHERRFADHGRIVGGDTDGLDLDPAPWPAVLVGVVEDLWAAAPADRFEDYADEVIAGVRANADRLADAPAALLHGDPNQLNCVRTGDGIGLVDWEASLVGDPAWELYRARCQLAGMPTGDGPDWLVEALHDGYRERAGSLPAGYDERAPVYLAVQFVLTVGWVDRTAGFLDDGEAFVEWVAAERERRLAAL